jgi:hypothetical protein
LPMIEDSSSSCTGSPGSPGFLINTMVAACTNKK